MKFPVIEFPSDIFGPWTDGVGHIEASSMGNRHLQRLYDDAMDLGFKVRSTQTDKVITYVFQSSSYSEGSEPELLSWTFTPTSDSLREFPECRDTKIVVFND